jgi:hypothetical protein
VAGRSGSRTRSEKFWRCAAGPLELTPAPGRLQNFGYSSLRPVAFATYVGLLKGEGWSIAEACCMRGIIHRLRAGGRPEPLGPDRATSVGGYRTVPAGSLQCVVIPLALVVLTHRENTRAIINASHCVKTKDQLSAKINMQACFVHPKLPELRTCAVRKQRRWIDCAFDA